MIKNYFKIAFRNIWKNKTYSAINIIGFAIGLASCLLILLFVNNEISFEKMHKNGDNIYRIAVNLSHGDNKIPFASVMPPLAPALEEEFPEVIDAVRIRQMQPDYQFEYDNRELGEMDVVFTESSFFDIFSFELISGDKQDVLTEPFSIVISQQTAEKYFGNEFIVGKTLSDENGNIFTITGIMEKPATNTQMDFDVLASYSSLKAMGMYSEQWGQFGTDHVYILADENLIPEEFEAKLPDLVLKKTNSAMASMIILMVQPFKEIYFYSHINNEFSPSGDIDQVYLFSAIAFLIMLIACLNFMNLSTARSAHRSKEVGMRKVFGSNKSQLIRQFLSESILITLISVVLGLIIFSFLYPELNNFIGRELSVNYLKNPLTILVILVLAVIVGILAGLYPAFFLSRFKPISAIQARSGKAKTLFRKIMVITQFTIAISLIIITITVFKQISYVKNVDLGFDKENKLIIPTPDSGQNTEILKEEVLKIPGVEMATSCFAPPGSGGALVMNAVTDDGDDETPPEGMMINALTCDYDYIPLFDLELVEGRNFDPDIASDKNMAVIINEAAVKEFGLQNPIGAEFDLPIGGGSQTMNVNEELPRPEVIGVLKDFHYRSLREEISPVALFMENTYFQNVIIKYSDNTDLPELIGKVKTEYQKLFPNEEFDYSFVDEEYNQLYNAEEKMGKLFFFFSILIIFVACLGIFGLASFLSEQRNREIGIRKVLGSTTTGVVKLLTTDFVKWVLVANLIAIPIAWYAMDKWLQNFAYRTVMSVWIFILSGVIILLIALFTISTQTIKAANLNPVETLKYE
ncbi:MAG: ABC transporter permease [Candidatus Cloacimonetes bacterium]|nr:ABC transporter permease [Candidatus Cloacimonadota bacterium]MCF7813113.1 ABC transporter permease [Candidatus Cloacimonadota bacterium]MCF7867561.1 ABC transporter permease [Candidatus Cloacimonadota bacterium]MCF7883045.1 ABC transporter permease [Candidatus Cloacimonadota bacterium]